MSWYWRQYLGADPDWDLPELHPTTFDLSLLPPTLLVTGEHDPLRDEGEELAAAIASAGVRCVATRYLGMPHAFWRMPTLDAAEQLGLQVAGFLGSASQAG
jgi:acetyl esterase